MEEKEIKERILSLLKEADPQNPIEYLDEIARPMAREKLDKLILSCKDCPANSDVKSVTYGNDQAAVLIINEGIYSSQIKEGVNKVYPLQGSPEMELMNEVIDSYHINRNQLFWANAVNCYTCAKVNNRLIERAPNNREAECCRGHLDNLIEILHPVLIILLGNIPLNLFVRGKTILQEHGKWIDIHGIKAMPVYSPHFLIQMNEDNKISDELLEEYQLDFCEDLKKAFLYVQDNFEGNVLLEPLIP